ncbi:MAG: rhodanese-like domain-containing protein [Alphaproteobacteria bacterium]|nr:rhodanese-like domain-containing protein [Alphaproteobacteria bacterium]
MPDVIDITPGEAKAWLENGDAIMVDVREPCEYEHIHIEGTPLIALSTFSPELVPFEKGKKLILQCKSGGRSMMAGQQMIAAGYPEDVYNMMGGIIKWEEESFPVVKG